MHADPLGGLLDRQALVVTEMRSTRSEERGRLHTHVSNYL